MKNIHSRAQYMGKGERLREYKGTIVKFKRRLNTEVRRQ